MCAAKGREEVIQSDLIENVNAGEPQGQLFVLSTKQVVGADTEIEEMTRSNPRRIGVVVLGAIGRNTHAQSAAICGSASENRRCPRSKGAAAEQTDLRLLV